MNAHLRSLFIVVTLLAGVAQATAQTFTTLNSFAGGSGGAEPYAGLILSGNTLYGTTEHGGTNGYGMVFAVKTDGAGFANLYNFTAAANNNKSDLTNRDGAYPDGSLTLSGNILYGTATQGGTGGYGTVTPSTPMALVLRTCIVSRHVIMIHL